MSPLRLACPVVMLGRVSLVSLAALVMTACGPKPEAVCDHIDGLVEAGMKVKPTPSQAAEARSNCVERMRDKDAACRACALRAQNRADVLACKCW